eukprot:scaffold101451_cov24-Tisochrysis_lutea.AAC.1
MGMARLWGYLPDSSCIFRRGVVAARTPSFYPNPTAPACIPPSRCHPRICWAGRFHPLCRRPVPRQQAVAAYRTEVHGVAPRSRLWRASSAIRCGLR